MNRSLFCFISRNQNNSKLITIVNGKMQEIIPLNAFNTVGYRKKCHFLTSVIENRH